MLQYRHLTIMSATVKISSIIKELSLDQHMNLVKLQNLYKERIVKLSRPAFYLVASIHGSSTLSDRFFVHLFQFDPKKYEKNKVIGKQTITEVESFVNRLKRDYFGEVTQEEKKPETPDNSDDTTSCYDKLKKQYGKRRTPTSEYPFRSIYNTGWEGWIAQSNKQESTTGKNALSTLLSGLPEYSEITFERKIQGNLPSQIESMAGVYSCISHKYPLQITHILDYLFILCDRSVIKLYNLVTSPHFSLSKIPGYQPNYEKRVCSFLESFLSDIETVINGCEESDIPFAALKKLVYELTDNEVLADNVVEFKKTNGYYPFFTIIQGIISSYPKVAQKALLNATKYYEEQEWQATNSIAKDRDIHPDIIRQMRKQYHNELKQTISSIKVLLPCQCPYGIEGSPEFEAINVTENTTFSNVFIDWAITLIYPDYHQVGKGEDALLSYNKKTIPSALFPAHFKKIFNIQKFLSDASYLSSKTESEGASITINALRSAMSMNITTFNELISSDDREELLLWCSYLLKRYTGIETESRS